MNDSTQSSEILHAVNSFCGKVSCQSFHLFVNHVFLSTCAGLPPSLLVWPSVIPRSLPALFSTHSSADVG